MELKDQVMAFKAVVDSMTELYAKKNKDYGNSFGKSFEEFGLTMSAIRIGDKFNRFKALIKNNSQVVDESIRDTLIDLACYSVMTVLELDSTQSTISKGEVYEV